MKRALFFTVLIVGVLSSSISFGYTGWSTGKTGNALSFDGVNDYVDVPGYQGIVGTQSRTCCAWIKTTGTQQGNIVSWGADQNGQKWIFRVESNGTLAVGVWGGYVYTTATVNNGQWHHVAAVLNSDGSPSVNEILLYIDGALRSTGASSTQSIETMASQEVMIGAYKNAGIPIGYFNGLLDDVRIYNRALSSGEIVPASLPTAGLVTSWAMDETDGIIAHDTLSHYDGTLINMISIYSGGSGTSADPYQIATPEDLLMMAVTPFHYSKNFILTSDIDLGGRIFTTAIIAPDTDSSTADFQGAAFGATFDGNGHKITHFTINGGSNDYLGLFGTYSHWYVDAVIKNLGLENYTISSSGNSSYVGSLCGLNDYGNIENCYTTGTVTGGDHSFEFGGLCGANYGTISHCYAAGTLTVGNISECHGGLCGLNYSVIEYCYTTGAVTLGNSGGGVGNLCGYNHWSGTISYCYAKGSTLCGNASYSVGGLCGNNYYGTINDCYALGAAGGAGSSKIGGLCGDNVYGNIRNCYSKGSTSGASNVGGLCGRSNSDTIINCFWDTETSRQAISAGGTGKTTAEMKTLTTFTAAGWDFAMIWDICEGTNYPRLQWQIPAGDFACPDGVNMEDLEYFAGRWMMDNCTSANNYCGGADVDSSGVVNLADWAVFAGHWLEGI